MWLNCQHSVSTHRVRLVNPHSLCRARLRSRAVYAVSLKRVAFARATLSTPRNRCGAKTIFRDRGPGRSCLAAGGPGTLPVLRPRRLVSMTTPTANWPELLKAVVLEVLGQPAEPGVRYAGTGRETRGRPPVHLEHPEERAGNLFSVLLSSGSFSQDWSFSPTTRPWC